jgi:uncharacterized protein (DUF2249 family)
MNTQELIGPDKVLDVTSIPCSIKHGLILKTWFELPVGDHFFLVNGHDPVPLRYQFESEFGGSVSWEYVERGPERVRVKISKLSQVAAMDLVSPCANKEDH